MAHRMMAQNNRYGPYQTVAVFDMQREQLIDDMKAFKWYTRSLPKDEHVPLETLRRMDVLISRFETLKAVSQGRPNYTRVTGFPKV